MRDLKTELLRVEATHRCGSVWRLLETFEDGSQKAKYFVYLCRAERAVFYLHTTSKGGNIPFSLQRDCIYVPKGTYAFWRLDTWITCHNPKYRKNLEFSKMVESAESPFVGVLSDGHVEQIHEIIQRSPHIEGIIKRLILAARNR